MIRRSIVLRCDPPRAFHLFTARISTWWPVERRHTGDPESTIVLAETGDFFERDRQGNQVRLGTVLAWDPPSRLLLDWFPGTDPDHPTRVEVTFVAEGLHTRVDVLHTATAASEALFPLRVAKYEASWTIVMDALSRATLDDA